MPSRHDDIDNYDAGDLSDDPFASPPPDSATKKRKANGDGGLGIDEEVSVQKRARVPNVKLDEERLLGPAGLPKLKARASNLKIKGKGHEVSIHSSTLIPLPHQVYANAVLNLQSSPMQPDFSRSINSGSTTCFRRQNSSTH